MFLRRGHAYVYISYGVWPMLNISSREQGVGEAVGSERMKREGQTQEIKGDAQQALGKAKDAVKGAANKAADEVNKRL